MMAYAAVAPHLKNGSTVKPADFLPKFGGKQRPKRVPLAVLKAQVQAVAESFDRARQRK